VIVRESVVLPMPVERAWAFLMDWERQAEWMRDADRVDVVSPHREGEGVVVAVKTRVLNVPAFTERLEVVWWQPPICLRLAHRGFVRGTGEWRLTPVARGEERGTRFLWEERLALPVPVLGALALAAYKPFMRMLMRGSLTNLRAVLIDRSPERPSLS
jgi:hypothetical protein